jgi:drug/metabolite transporter (DMT)-like permease
MSLPLDTALPLIAAIAYAVSALYLKQATIEGGGLWRITFLVNWGQALFLLPLSLLGNAGMSAQTLWHVLVTSLVFFVGQLCVFAGMRYGDVSVVTPVMGVKVIFVAASVTLFAQQKLPLLWWCAAAISSGAALLLAGGRPKNGRGVWPGVVGGLSAALAFSSVDVLYQQWAGALGVWKFSAYVAIAMALWSLTLLPILEDAWWKLPSTAIRAFIPGLFATVIQVLLMAYCVVELKGAAWANLLYSSRGLWSILLVWGAGAAFGNSESEAGRNVMVWRLAGAGSMLAAITLVLF